MIYWITKKIVWVYFKLFYRLKVYGKENFPKDGGIIASNHISYLDPPVIGISAPGSVHFFARDTLFRFPLFGWFLRALHSHPIRRGKGNIESFKLSISLLKKQMKIVIFPEGRRSSTGQLQKGQAGIGMMIQKSDCQVIPVYIHGTYEIWKPKQKMPKPWGKTACVFGSPLSFPHYEMTDKKAAQKEIVNRIMQKITELRDWYHAGAKGTPP